MGPAPQRRREAWTEAGLITDERTFTSGAGCYADSVAEHVLALMLAGARRLHDLSRARTWTSPDPVSFVGPGWRSSAAGIGQALIELLVPFQCRVLAVTRSGRTVQGAAVSTDPSGIPAFLEEADYVILGAPRRPRRAR